MELPMEGVFEIVVDKLGPADLKLAEQKWQFLKLVVSAGFVGCLSSFK
jgi:hypothetical protein